MTIPVSDKLGLVVALPAEARALVGGRWQFVDGRLVRRVSEASGPEQIWVRCGVGHERAAAAARWLVGQDVKALGVLGVSGGLAPALASGQLVIADGVIDAVGSGSGTTLASRGKEDLLTALREAGLPATGGNIVTVAEPVLEPEHKAALGRERGALAVDMESGAVARVAAEAGLGMFALRAICDPAQRKVSRALFDMIDQTGGLRLNVLLAAVLRRPQLIIDLLAMQRDFSRALKALRRGSRVVVKRVMSTW